MDQHFASVLPLQVTMTIMEEAGIGMMTTGNAGEVDRTDGDTMTGEEVDLMTGKGGKRMR